ncbi:MAG: type II secretion system major pseudopilin GspG [Sinobacteraceae bacterium]|jgi:general secretion pathway protein G|nr:type II secretion system major pseudopilin GspG [Nevskiaceae bacterium]
MNQHQDDQHVSRHFSQRRRPPHPAGQRGFTLIEIMVVVIIIGLLAAVIVPQVIDKVDQARTTKAKADIQSIETALTMFRLDNSKYPTTDQGLQALVVQPTDPSIRHWRPGGYIQRVSKDPWGNDYQYVYPGTHGKEYDLFTLGSDGQPGGEGTAADIGNWNIQDQ